MALADVYLAAATNLWTQLQRIAGWRLDKGGQPGQIRDMAPVHVLEGLAIEIYLKALLKYSGSEPPRDHGLVTMFNTLPEAWRSWLQAVYDRRRAEARMSVHLDEHLDGIKAALFAKDNFNHEWRYFYEDGRLDQGLKRTGGSVELGVLAQTLQRASHRFAPNPVKPDYTTYEDELWEKLSVFGPKPRTGWIQQVTKWLGA